MERRAFILSSLIPVLQASLGVASPIDPNHSSPAPERAG
jgi:hypothetical protein